MDHTDMRRKGYAEPVVDRRPPPTRDAAVNDAGRGCELRYRIPRSPSSS
ncbi:hypothetical protein NKG94_46125 [Micromonospora sp. M12]